MQLFSFLTITLWLLIGGATAYFANQRGRDPIIWFMVGLGIGLFGLLLLFLLPLSSEQEKKETEAAESLPRPLIHDYLVKDWFYFDRNRLQQGPIRFERLKELWKSNEINEQSFVWSEGMAEWQKVEEVHSLYTHLQLG